MKNKKSNASITRKKINILSINIIIFLFLIFSVASIFEILLRRTNPYSLFPKEMTDKKAVIIGNKYLSFYDGKSEIERYEPKTKVLYKHNNYGFRINENESKKNFSYNLSNSLIVFGDSTSYGLNIDNKNTFANLLSQEILKRNAYNFSYPGMNLESITYKVNCLNNILQQKKLRNKMTVIGLYFNDIENLGKLNNLDPNKCQSIKNINLTNAEINSKFLEIDITKRLTKKSYWIERITNLKKYPLYLDLLICRKLFSRTCYIAKFSISNLHPRLKTFIFGSHEVNSLYGRLSKNDFEILENNKKNFQDAVNDISLNSDLVVLFYIPRHEIDLINSYKLKKRERVFYLFKEICENEIKKSNIICIDGTDVIADSISEDIKKRLIKNGRLPNKYYSYLPFFDMGHPSKFLSKIYKEKILKEYQRLFN